MKNFWLLLFVLLGNYSQAQEAESYSDLRFPLEVNLHDIDNSSPIANAHVHVLGMDGLDTTILSDANGKVEMRLKPNTSYTIEASAKGYLNVVAHKTTKNLSQSTKIVVDLKMQFKTCQMFLPTISYAVNDFKKPLNSHLPDINLFDLYTDVINKSGGTFQLTGFSDENESPKMAEKRVTYFQKQLEQRGIPSYRMKTVVAPNSSSAKEFTGPSMQDKERFTSNRVVLIGVI